MKLVKKVLQHTSSVFEKTKWFTTKMSMRGRSMEQPKPDISFPLDTGYKVNVHKTFRSSIYVLCVGRCCLK